MQELIVWHDFRMAMHYISDQDGVILHAMTDEMLVQVYDLRGSFEHLSDAIRKTIAAFEKAGIIDQQEINREAAKTYIPRAAMAARQERDLFERSHKLNAANQKGIGMQAIQDNIAKRRGDIWERA